MCYASKIIKFYKISSRFQLDFKYISYYVKNWSNMAKRDVARIALHVSGGCLSGSTQLREK